MAFSDIITTGLRPLMPRLRGTLAANQPLADLTSLGVGGVAQALFTPQDEDDLAYFLAHLSPQIPVTALGHGSNMLVRDGGIEGVVIKIEGKSFSNLTVEDTRLLVGAAVLNRDVAERALDHSIAGLEFFCGIPASVGGSLRMNAGGYGGDVAKVFAGCRAIDRKGAVHVLTEEDMKFAYRVCGAPVDYVFIDAILAGNRGNQSDIRREMRRIRIKRRDEQPHERSAGSTFKNPSSDLSAWKLIDQAGCRGLKCGGAAVSEIHANFLINPGRGATAYDIETLGEAVRHRVKQVTKIELEWEVRRIGVLPPHAGVATIPEFIHLIETGDERGTECFVLLARKFIADDDQTRLRDLFRFYYPRLGKEGQAEVAYLVPL
jgi:UDP-N-acetylmuramate dehydrogenase